jgi:hypothetical protein
MSIWQKTSQRVFLLLVGFSFFTNFLLIQILNTTEDPASFGPPSLRFGNQELNLPFISKELQVKVGDDHVKEQQIITKAFSTSTKALLLSFPGSGSERVRALLQQATGNVGFASSIVQDNSGLDPNLLDGTPKNTTTTTTNDGGVVLVDIQLGGARIQDGTKRRQQYHLVKTIPKNIVLVRDPFDAIWSRYERAQTGSYNRHIASRDFHPLHFAMQANEWAEEYADGKFTLQHSTTQNPRTKRTALC